MEIPILILGAGASSRMEGLDKLLQPVDGLPLIRRQAEIALRAGIGPVLVALPPAPHPRHDALAGLDLRKV
ncbi:MAG: nucleotidyltransferase family protein, partial [Rhodobacteraceae bacterium]